MTERWTYEYAYPIPAPAERIFASLTGPAELQRWFAEHARIDPRVGGRFEFWGRHTVGTPGEGEAGGTITAYDLNERLGFEWTLFGVPSRVNISLSPVETDQGPATKVAIEHAFEGVFDMPRPKELVDDWWRFNLGNLAAHAAGHGEVLRVDFDDPSPEIRLSMHMDAPPEKVFRALTEPECLNQWMAKEASVDLREGGAFDLGFLPEGYQGPGMRILELVLNEKITLSWPDWRGDTSVPFQSVSWILAPEEGGTGVTLIHSGFIRAADLSDYPFGWVHFLGRLKAVAEGL